MRPIWIAALLLLPLLPLPAFPAAADVTPRADYSLRFYGQGVNDIDRVKIQLDDVNDSLPGPPADIGGEDFTMEFWMKANASDNDQQAVSCGSNINWINGNIIIDRDRYNQDRKWGLSIAGGVFVWGVSGDGTGDYTICGTTDVLDFQWHHVAVTRNISDGWMRLFVDGKLESEGDGPDGNVSYPDDGVPGNYCGGPCDNSDPYLVLGAEKHDAGSAYPPYTGLMDEFRISNMTRYTADFLPPTAPFSTDGNTVGLYHFDDGPGNCAGLVSDVSGALGGPSNGQCRYGGSGNSGPVYDADVPFATIPSPPQHTLTLADPGSRIIWAGEPITIDITYTSNFSGTVTPMIATNPIGLILEAGSAIIEAGSGTFSINVSFPGGTPGADTVELEVFENTTLLDTLTLSFQPRWMDPDLTASGVQIANGTFPHAHSDVLQFWNNLSWDLDMFLVLSTSGPCSVSGNGVVSISSGTSVSVPFTLTALSSGTCQVEVNLTVLGLQNTWKNWTLSYQIVNTTTQVDTFMFPVSTEAWPVRAGESGLFLVNWSANYTGTLDLVVNADIPVTHDVPATLSISPAGGGFDLTIDTPTNTSSGGNFTIQAWNGSVLMDSVTYWLDVRWFDLDIYLNETEVESASYPVEFISTVVVWRHQDIDDVQISLVIIDGSCSNLTYTPVFGASVATGVSIFVDHTLTIEEPGNCTLQVRASSGEYPASGEIEQLLLITATETASGLPDDPSNGRTDDSGRSAFSSQLGLFSIAVSALVLAIVGIALLLSMFRGRPRRKRPDDALYE